MASWWGVKTCLTVSNPPVLKQECSECCFLSKQFAAHVLPTGGPQQTASHSDKGGELSCGSYRDLRCCLLLFCRVAEKHAHRDYPS